jgi:membrane-associated phospholipid phosphatase
VRGRRRSLTYSQLLHLKHDAMSSAVAAPSVVPSAGSHPLRFVTQPRLVALLLAALAAAAGALLVILTVTGMSLAPEFGYMAILAAAVGALAGYCHWRKFPWRLTDSASIVGIVLASLLLCGLVSCLGLRLGIPLADPMLARGDALVGFDVRRVASFVAARPALSALLNFAYNNSGPLCAAAVVWNLLTDRLQLWRLMATLIVAMQITALVSTLFPAHGAAVWLGVDALQGNGLPYGAGTYSVAEFGHFYSGSDLLVRGEDMGGIVCFPSFHTVMALVILQGFANSRLRWAAVPWSALTIVSTVPMGGHYVVDLAGGVLVWIVACRLATWACRFPQRAAGPAPWQERLMGSLQRLSGRRPVRDAG